MPELEDCLTCWSLSISLPIVFAFLPARGIIARHALREARLVVGHPWHAVTYANVSSSFYQPRALNRYAPAGTGAYEKEVNVIGEGQDTWIVNCSARAMAGQACVGSQRGAPVKFNVALPGAAAL